MLRRQQLSLYGNKTAMVPQQQKTKSVMEKKFTQGEWKITHDCLDKDTYAGCIRIGTYKSIWTAEAKVSHVGPENIDEIRANAKLIAAAPDLLEATELAKQFIDYAKQAGLKLWSDKMQLMYEASAKLDNAIKKALE